MSSEPEECPSETVRVRCPEGTVFVIFDKNPDPSDPSEALIHRIDVKIGHGDFNSHAHANGIALMATAALRAGASIDDLAKQLRGISHGNSNPLTAEALSIADAIGIAMFKFARNLDE